jgi:hypothetical protein
LSADLAWSAEVMVMFRGEVNSFVSFEREFDREYIAGDWQACLRVLKKVDESHGLSLWLMHRLSIDTLRS